MTAKTHTISVSRTARYFTLGELNETTERVWFVLHGYGQLAEYFIRKFEKLNDGRTLVVAPEALSRFYTDAEYKRVGASWMTRQSSKTEIDDYVAYLESIYKTIFEKGLPKAIQLTVFGFSQGATTACRWLNQGTISCDRLVIWAGYFANGIQDVIDPARIPSQTYYIFGDQDQFLNQIDFPEYLVQLRKQIPGLNILDYAGTHTVDPEILGLYFGNQK
ncbi:alpha/beta hydrolase [Arundinibacter roseus]|uniref:Phospholipase n=1 Tax=Arundinibacter roseus TaxID=2070510 RepID=A0A4R4KGX5_9BACT|nr:phospholipase [Arundinibacter roseus]TDB65861.1 phospholipase [Arundinibacter roseus]